MPLRCSAARHGVYLNVILIDLSMAVRPTRCSAVPAWLCVAALLFLASLHSASLQDTGGTSICSSEREECEVEELLAEISGASDDAAKGEDAAGDGRAWARRGGAFQADESLDELRDRAVRMFYHGYDRCIPGASSCFVHQSPLHSRARARSPTLRHFAGNAGFSQ